MSSSNKIRLFWWNEIKMQGKSKENYGDLLGKYLVEKISGKQAVWVKPKAFSFVNFFKPIYVTIGSILTNVTNNCIVWGSGIVSKEYHVENASFLAVRGPQTRAFLIEKGYYVPEVYGDPALLFPRYYNPKVKKTHRIGIIPHYNDYKKVKDFYTNESDVLLIDLMTNNIEETTNKFLACEKIVSSSLHGIIIAHAYGIPAVWQKFSNDVFGDDIKYQDYFESVLIESYKSEIVNSKMTIPKLEELFVNKQALPKAEVIEDLCDKLMTVCPFKPITNA
ncbi:exosortase [Tamlana nanhaiensis]|uniref:Exosortase n=1 Tax=Neotamlana nanhaiensis TaxID=1382798 RepID=A0A0D7W3P8_9FLAO|nr:polysaccharide pyruvyl transferase family protein [Tamlana nanhaiensis]KJD33664.1 exosortase [Tamlana nanhaiensis]